MAILSGLVNGAGRCQKRTSGMNGKLYQEEVIQAVS